MAAVANSYARAFAEVVIDRHLDGDQVLRELHEVIAVLSESSDLRRIWENPAISADQKRKVLDAISARESFSRPLRNFVAVLIDHHRVPFLNEIARQFELEINRRLGFAEAEITSARELGDNEKSDLEQQVAKLTGKKVRARYLRDETILGGAIVKLGSTIYDGSVRGQLEKIKEAISS